VLWKLIEIYRITQLKPARIGLSKIYPILDLMILSNISVERCIAELEKGDRLFQKSGNRGCF
jgi:hypothetical protein